ncbi:MAG: type II toxin-antitoxin system RelB/DinJ family antitoxin [Balneolaceae bacterium]
MSTKTTTVRARVEPKLKEETERIFDELGISTTEAIRMFFAQVKIHRGLPFDVKVPNKNTQQAIVDATTGEGVKTFDSPEELFDDLDI